MKWIGKTVPRKEGREKVTGRAQYVDDITMSDLWYGVTVRSPVPRGKLREVRFGEGIPWKEIVVVTAKDIPGKNHGALNEPDQPFLADGVINHAEEPVLLLGHPDKHLLEKARTKVELVIDPIEPCLDFELSKEVLKSYLVEKGDVDSVWKRDDILVVEGEYRTGAQEQLYIENNGMIAVANSAEGVTVWGSIQCPYYVHRALKLLFNLPDEKIRVIQMETGGGFGGKEEYPSVIAGHAALLALKCRRPVKIIYDRAEDMAATTKRHPSLTRHRTAVTKQGKLVAQEIDFTLDAGAYVTLSPVVLSRGTIHAAGPYACPNVRVKSRAVLTHTPPHGAFRGFGAPQSLFAVEKHMNRVARAVGLSPEEFRRRNFLNTGDTTATGQLIQEKLDLDGILARALKESDYVAKRKRFQKENAKSRIKRGMGIATFMHGAGFTGSGERAHASVVAVEGTRDGRVRVLTANTEIGQGTNTVFAQIVAEALGLPLEEVDVVRPDTKLVPNSGPTVASRTTMVVGKLIEDAALGMKATLVQAGLLGPKPRPEDFKRACAGYVKQFGNLKAFAEYRQPGHIEWDDKKYRGDAYGTYAWAAYVAEVSVDTTTFIPKVEDFVAVQEVGRVVHPLFAEGQIVGGVAQGVGFALYEKVIWKGGRMVNNRMTNYIMPTAVDVPSIRVFFEEEAYEHGPGGAKGIGELPIDGPGPAILNAVEDALGVELSEIPCLPEDVMQAMEGGTRVR